MITGCDVSEYQHPEGKPINYKLVKEKGIDFAIVQYKDEAGKENPYFLEDHNGFKGAGIGTGSYIFLRPDGVKLAEQAEDLRAIAKYGPVWGDLEVTGGLNGVHLRSWWEQLHDAAPHIGMVSYPAFLEAYGPFSSTAPFWIDSFGASKAPAEALLWGMTDQAKVPGIPALVDLDAFLGTKAQLDSMFGIGFQTYTYKGFEFKPTAIIANGGHTFLGVPDVPTAERLEKLGAELVRNPNGPGVGLFLEVP